jgi:hypothetical protein
MKIISLLEAIMHQVESSNIDSIGWEDDILEVTFLSGSTYEYYDVPEEVFEEMLDASSKGQYLARNIKGVYSYNKIN